MKIDIKLTLKLHLKWLRGEKGGERANLSDADLSNADLRGADLSNADLRGANLRNAYLSNANLRGAYLSDANLRGADLRGAYLSDAYLRGANLRGADLRGAYLAPHSIVPSEGAFIGWKKTTEGVIKVRIPEDAKRTSSLIGRKCRASKIEVVGGVGCGGKSPNKRFDDVLCLTYNKGETVIADSFDYDIRVECTHGIHFFMTKEEAEQW